MTWADLNVTATILGTLLTAVIAVVALHENAPRVRRWEYELRDDASIFHRAGRVVAVAHEWNWRNALAGTFGEIPSHVDLSGRVPARGVNPRDPSPTRRQR